MEYASSMFFISGGSLKSGASLANGGQKSALTIVASRGDFWRTSEDAVSRAAGVPGAGGALTLPLIRFESSKSLSMTSHL